MRSLANELIQPNGLMSRPQQSVSLSWANGFEGPHVVYLWAGLIPDKGDFYEEPDEEAAWQRLSSWLA